MKLSRSVLMILTVMSTLAVASVSQAHKVTIFAWSDGDRVHTESKFSGGKRVKDGKVEVFDDSGTLLLTGRTDEDGAFSFSPPRITDLNIVLIAGMGHQNSWRLSAAELGATETAPAISTPAAPAANENPPRPSPTQPTPPQHLTAEEIEAIVARQLEKKIQPLMRMVAASQDNRPTLTDVVGGIGYIIGLVGLAAYFRYRRKDRRS